MTFPLQKTCARRRVKNISQTLRVLMTTRCDQCVIVLLCDAVSRKYAGAELEDASADCTSDCINSGKKR